MKTFRSIVVGLFAAVAFFAVSTLAQTGGATAAGNARVVVIDTGAFADEKAGITKYTNAMKALNTEFAGVQSDLQTTQTKAQTLGKELEILKTNAESGKVPVSPATYQTKLDQFNVLKVELTRKTEDAKARFERRQEQVMGPIMQDIYKAMQEFTKQKGYGIVLDAAKLDGSGLLIGFDEKYDVTKEFIAFYTARPATTASAGAPR